LLNISAGTSGILWDLELGFKRNLSSRLWKIMSLVENILRDAVQVQRTSNLRNPPCATPNVHAVPGPTPEKHYRKQLPRASGADSAHNGPPARFQHHVAGDCMGITASL
jgi:hypothetical protein